MQEPPHPSIYPFLRAIIGSMMDPTPEHQKQTPPAGEESAEEMVKVVDRQGNVKTIPRSQYEARKRRRKRRESSTKNIPFREIFSVAIILIIIAVASYLALHYIK
jgi:hypothetical protein